MNFYFENLCKVHVYMNKNFGRICSWKAYLELHKEGWAIKRGVIAKRIWKDLLLKVREKEYWKKDFLSRDTNVDYHMSKDNNFIYLLMKVKFQKKRLYNI